MQAIKFRAWDSKTNKYMWPWPDGGFRLFGEVTCFDTMGQQFHDAGEDRLTRYNDLIIEQYICIKDSNGQEIYEGDIIKWQEKLINGDGVIEKTGCVNYNAPAFFLFPYCGGFPNDCEIIGNIHENKELLGTIS